MNGIVVNGSLNRRSSPDASSTILGQYHDGEYIEVYIHNADWYRTVFTYNGVSTVGYVNSDYVIIPDDTVIIRKNDVNVRNGMGTNAAYLYTVDSGATALVTAIGNPVGSTYGWIEGNYGNGVGWVRGDMFKKGTSASGSTSEDYTIPAIVDTDKHGNGGTLNLRNTAGGTTIASIPDGATIYVKSMNGTWLAAKYNGYTGYVQAAYIMGTDAYNANNSSGGDNTSLPSSGLFYARVSTNSGTLTMRKGPGTNYAFWYAVPKGRIVLCEGITNGWYKTRYKGQEAYLSGDYMTRLSTPTVHSTYFERCMYLYTGDVGNTSASYYDGASGPWCQHFVNWLLRASYMPSYRVPTDGGTGWGIAFFAKNENNNGGRFLFKSAEHKRRINNETKFGYNLNVGNTLTSEEISYIPEEGDLIYIRWNNAASDVNVSHTGIVKLVENGEVHIVEGNATQNAYVYDQRRFSLTDPQIVGYAKPNYSM